MWQRHSAQSPSLRTKIHCVTAILSGLFAALFMMPPPLRRFPWHLGMAPRSGIDNKLYYWICLLPLRRNDETERWRATFGQDPLGLVGVEARHWGGFPSQLNANQTTISAVCCPHTN